MKDEVSIFLSFLRLRVLKAFVYVQKVRSIPHEKRLLYITPDGSNIT